MQFSSAIPVLRIFSEPKAKEFYVDFLGFVLEWEHRFAPGLPLYAQVRRGDLILHLSEHHGDATPGSTVFAPLEGIDTLRDELHAKHYAYARPSVERYDWGRVMEIADPFGNRLRFCERDAQRG
ncbi:bleomycin resistance protein [Burkholderia singularis]|uniref:Bleomycin resistance protein n=1 Tax=Burkholderia singularis TaxID=1503053 RepID=A0A118DNQ2_9BURK|nr:MULTISPECIES: glyoxalase superfamily protein [Burkholderia]AOK28129.1 bleomycin resistance protein [Burkholderia sp. Bp7605]KVE26794.1 bleomycin resistance protein [Burkholderia singularis]SMG01937.1 Glyoxalase family protein [Burkholderia singularis]